MQQRRYSHPLYSAIHGYYLNIHYLLFFCPFFHCLHFNHPLTITSSDNPEAVEGLASVHVDAIAQITRVIRLPSLLLPQESAFIVEMVKKIYAWGADVRTMDHLVSMVSCSHSTLVTHLCLLLSRTLILPPSFPSFVSLFLPFCFDLSQRYDGLTCIVCNSMQYNGM